MAAGDAPVVRIEWIAGSSPSIVVSGEIDVVTAPTFAQMVDVALACGQCPVRIDLSEATFIDASVLGIIASAEARHGADSGPVLEIVGASGLVAKVFEIADLDHMLLTRVLVVDDDEGVRTTTCEILQSAGYDIAGAEDGEQALALLGADVHAMVLDLHLPKLDGLAVLDALPSAPPVIVVSAFEFRSRDLVESRYGSRVAAFLQKPVPPVVLLDTVKECLGKTA
jgi:anti-anti-sigma factor